MILIKQAMILAAGFGKRLKPLTDETPKPLIPVGDTTCLDEIIRRLQTAGVQKIVVNTHHLANQIHQHLSNYPGLFISYEPEILQTGGGIAKALRHFGEQPFFSINADIWWWEDGESILKKMAKAWDSQLMDILLMVVPKHQTIGYYGQGDYNLDDENCLRLRTLDGCGDYVYGGVQILSPAAFKKSRFWPHQTIFPITKLFAETEQRNRLHGFIHDNLWADIGSPQGLEETRAKLPMQEPLSE